MDHAPGSDTFQKHYLSRNVNADLWAIHRATELQTALLQQATSHGSSRNTRWLIKLTLDQLASLKTDPLYVWLGEQLLKLRKGSEAYRQVANRRKQVLAKARNEKLASVREEWNHT